MTGEVGLRERQNLNSGNQLELYAFAINRALAAINDYDLETCLSMIRQTEYFEYTMGEGLTDEDMVGLPMVHFVGLSHWVNRRDEMVQLEDALASEEMLGIIAVRL